MDARRDLEAVDTRLTANTDAHDAIPVQAPHDALLDFAIALRDSIRGRTENAHSIEDVNRALIETFDSMAIWEGPDETLPPEQGVHAGTIKIDPNLREEVLYGMLRERVADWPKLGKYEPPAIPRTTRISPRFRSVWRCYHWQRRCARP